MNTHATTLAAVWLLGSLAAWGCSGGSGTDSTSTLPDKCAAQKGPLGTDNSADFQVRRGDQAVVDNEVVSIDSGPLSAGQTVDTEFVIVNGAGSTAQELKLESTALAYTAPDGVSDPKTPVFECLVSVDGVMKPCAGHDFGSIVPPGFDPDCATSSPVNSARVVIRFRKQADDTPRLAKLTLTPKGDVSWEGKSFRIRLLTKTAVSLINVTPPVVDFGTVKLSEEYTLPVTILNAGDADLLVHQIDFTLNDAKPFSMTIDDKTFPGGASYEFKPPIVVKPKNSQKILVKFSGLDAQKHSSTVTVHSNSGGTCKPVNGVVNIEECNAKTVNLFANQSVPCLLVKPSNKVNFGFVTIGELSKRTVELSNCGSGDVEVSGLDVVEDAAGVFGADTSGIEALKGKPVSPANPLLVAVNKPVTVQVACEPSSENKGADGKAKPFLANLKFADNTIQPDKVLALECWGSASSCPTAVIQTDEGEQIVPQQELQLRGGLSFAMPGKQVTGWKWEVLKSPAGAEGLTFYPNATVADPKFGVKTESLGVTSFPVNVAGEYEFKLTVTDNTGLESCQPAYYTVLVIPDQAIHVELLWDTPDDPDKTDTGPGQGADLDLHFTHQTAEVGKICQEPPEMCKNDKGQMVKCSCQYDVDADGKADPWFHGLFDAYWYNPAPNWGSSSAGIDDNPGLDLDDTDGWGPENLNLKAPENDVTYTVGVHYWDSYGFGKSFATVKIWIHGTLTAIYDRPLVECDMWWVKKILWPSGELVDVSGAVADATAVQKDGIWKGSQTGKVTAKYKSALAAMLGGVCGK
jgi:hypothetical protein